MFPHTHLHLCTYEASSKRAGSHNHPDTAAALSNRLHVAACLKPIYFFQSGGYITAVGYGFSNDKHCTSRLLQVFSRVHKNTRMTANKTNFDVLYVSHTRKTFFFSHLLMFSLCIAIINLHTHAEKKTNCKWRKRTTRKWVTADVFCPTPFPEGSYSHLYLQPHSIYNKKKYVQFIFC